MPTGSWWRPTRSTAAWPWPSCRTCWPGSTRRAAHSQYRHRRATDPAPGLELTVYRVVQEALTNALKHAGVGADVEVVLAYAAEAVVVRVVDDGRGRPLVSPAPSGGHGLLGMRERVTVYDGSLTVGPRPTGAGSSRSGYRYRQSRQRR
ncbi:ATP-binding protein [Micromonospora sp. M12]